VCTVSWAHQPGGYHLLCNRDEKRTRGTAFAPRVVEVGGVRYIAPIDPDGGGTWLASNEYGVSLCLLNGQAVIESAGRRRSRGLLIRELAGAPSADDCALWTKQLELRPYSPFALVILEPGRRATLAQWDGRELAIDADSDAHMPLTSSSYDAEGVRRSRLKEFSKRVGPARGLDPALLYWFHSSHGASPDAYSTCMHRGDAETVSFSWVVVTREAIRFLYSPGAPCQSRPSEQKILTRAGGIR
jgi:Transport and Golgi organisation 2